jgi:hypothetical protein
MTAGLLTSTMQRRRPTASSSLLLKAKLLANQHTTLYATRMVLRCLQGNQLVLCAHTSAYVIYACAALRE